MSLEDKRELIRGPEEEIKEAEKINADTTTTVSASRVMNSTSCSGGSSDRSRPRRIRKRGSHYEGDSESDQSSPLISHIQDRGEAMPGDRRGETERRDCHRQHPASPVGASATQSSSSPSPVPSSPGVDSRRTSPPAIKKCRICFQTDILNERALAVGKGPDTSISGVIRSIFTAPWSRGTASSQPAIPTIDDGFISPCACKGSMAWVHRQCLEEWRYKSARRDSFYACEYCFVSYRFKHTWLAGLLHHPVVLLMMTLLVTMATTLAVVFLAGAIFPLRLVDLAEQLMVDSTLPPSTATSHPTGGRGDGGLFGIDGIFMETTYAGHRWDGHADSADDRPGANGIGGRQRNGQRPAVTTTASMTRMPTTTTTATTTRASTDQTAKPTRTVRMSLPNTGLPIHSRISYFNVAYWLTGHSMDEREEEQNDFLLAMMDTGTIRLWLVSAALLGMTALVHDFTTWSLLVATCLVFGLVGLQLSSSSGGINVLAWLFFPIPVSLGIYRYLCWQYEVIEMAMDTFIKNFSSELENYQPPASLSSPEAASA